MRIARGAALLLVLLAPGAAVGQVGDISNVTYPGWIPSDRVAPDISVTVSYDTAADLWLYDYVVANDATAEQPIKRLTLRIDAPVTRVTRPRGWFVLPPFFAVPAGGLPGVTFAAEESEEIIETPAGAVPAPPPAAITPGRSLSGFSLASRYPPGYVRTYVQGFAPVPFLPDGFDEPTVVPDDTTNSRRGWTIGPTRYSRVAAARRTPADGFLVVMNLEPNGTTLRDPAPIALDLAAGGETVFRETLRVELNGQDVTAAFHPGPPDGADLVAVFRLGSSPLKAGRNVLTARIDGVLPGANRRAVDTERIVFHVQP